MARDGRSGRPYFLEIGELIMTGFRKDGAEAVYINGARAGALSGSGANAIASEAGWKTIIDGVVFDDDPTSMNSAPITVTGLNKVWVLLDIDSTSNPTTITFTPQYTDDGGNTYYDFQQGIWASMIFEDTATAAGIKKAFILDMAGIDMWRMSITTAGTDASKKFTVTVKTRGYN
ncbi:unnamed protein product [marine sediment metagenome]|uniref:Uncharacterized protein n=1 Tax=marine sediment metagenome TaxID=412755 RepID=X1BWS0_9ZZZZ